MSTENNLVPDTNYLNRFGHIQYKSPELLNPSDHALILVDHEGQMAFPIESTPKLELRNNLATLGYFSKIYEVPVILSTIGEKIFAGPLMKEIRQFYPDAPVYDRMSMNLWEDDKAREAVIATGKKRLVFAGLLTDICLAFPVLSALKAGYEVYFITDASGACTKEVHETSIRRMIQAGAIPLATMTYMAELFRDFTREDNASPDMAALVHDGFVKYLNFGMGVDYADYMVQNYPSYKGFEKK